MPVQVLREDLITDERTTRQKLPRLRQTDSEEPSSSRVCWSLDTSAPLCLKVSQLTFSAPNVVHLHSVHAAALCAVVHTVGTSMPSCLPVPLHSCSVDRTYTVALQCLLVRDSGM